MFVLYIIRIYQWLNLKASSQLGSEGWKTPNLYQIKNPEENNFIHFHLDPSAVHFTSSTMSSPVILSYANFHFKNDFFYKILSFYFILNLLNLNLQGGGIFSGFTKLCKGLTVILIGGHIVVRLLPSSVIYLALIPARFFLHFTFFFHYFDVNFIQLRVRNLGRD